MEGLKFFLLILQVVISVALVISILIQQSDGDSLSGIGGSGANNANSAISGRAATSLISKITYGLIFIFFLNSLVLGSVSKIANNKLQKDLEKVVKDYGESESTSSKLQEDKQNTQNNSAELSKKPSDESTKPPLDRKKHKAPIIPSVE